MNLEHQNDELIELGAASAATRGPSVGMDDHKGGLIPFAGICEE